jgi:hypothetical protein
MVEIRTYKTGLRAPDTLLKGISSLAREREVLRFLERNGKGEFDAFLKATSGLQHSPREVKNWYKNIFVKRNGKPPGEIKRAVEANDAAFHALKAQDPRFKDAFTGKDIKQGSGTATPDPAFISLHDYNHLAGESFKMTCATVNTIAMETVEALPGAWEDEVAGAFVNVGENGKDIKEGSLRKYPEKAIAHYLGRHGNVELTAFEQAAAMLKVHEDMRGKVDEARGLLFSPDHDFYNAEMSYLYTYSVPKALLYHLSSTWNVDLKWARNTLVGWRRKIDSLLPVKCQVESLVDIFSSLAEHAGKLVEDEDQLKVIGILQRKRVLHLLSTCYPRNRAWIFPHSSMQGTVVPTKPCGKRSSHGRKPCAPLSASTPPRSPRTKSWRRSRC